MAKTKNTIKSHHDYTEAFYSDLVFPEMYHAVLLRNTEYGIPIDSISFPNNTPEDLKLFTNKDYPGKKYVNFLNTEIKVFADDCAEYIGESAGIICAKEMETLLKYKDEIKIIYKDVPKKTNHNDELNVIKEENILEKRFYMTGDFDETFLNSKIKTEKDITSNIVYTNKNETQGAIVFWNNEKLEVFTPTQWPLNLRENLSNILNINENQIIIHKTKTTSFESNSLWINTILTCQAAIVSFNLKKPVKLVLSREEQDNYIDKPILVSTKYKIACDDNKKISAIGATIIINSGAGNPFIKEILDRLIIAAMGVYDCKNIKLEAYAVKTENQPFSANLHWIDAQIIYGIETVISDMACKLNLQPAEFRIENLQNPKKLSQGKTFTIPTNTLPQLLNILQKQSDFQRKYISYSLNTKLRKKFDIYEPVRGIGISCAYEGSGLFGNVISPSNFFIEVEMQVDNTVTIYSYTPSKSIENIWKKTVSEILDIPVENVKISSHFTDSNEPSVPETLNDNISIMTQLLTKCCNAIQKQRFRHPLPISITRAFTSSRKNKWHPESMTGNPFYSNSLGACVAEIEIDPCTFIEKIRGIYLTIDGGKILSPYEAELTVKTNVQKVLSSFHKEIELDVQNIQVTFLKSEEEPKQIGELVYNLLPAALGTAISNAFSHTIHHIPLELDSVFKLVQTT